MSTVDISVLLYLNVQVALLAPFGIGLDVICLLEGRSFMIIWGLSLRASAVFGPAELQGFRKSSAIL